MCLFSVKLNSVTLLNSLLGLGAFLSILWYLLCKKSYSLPVKTVCFLLFNLYAFVNSLLAVLPGRGLQDGVG